MTQGHQSPPHLSQFHSVNLTLQPKTLAFPSVKEGLRRRPISQVAKIFQLATFQGSLLFVSAILTLNPAPSSPSATTDQLAQNHTKVNSWDSAAHPRRAWGGSGGRPSAQAGAGAP